MRFLATVGVLAILLAIGVGGYFLGGYYNVAATTEDSSLVAQALTRVRQASIAQRATGQPPAALDTPAALQEGAKAYAKHGCASCHGGPGVEWAKFSEGLNPGPPDLKKIGDTVTVPQLFWIVKNGIRMTGMPSFAKAGATDDEIWRIAAFVKKLPTVSEPDYKAWTAQ